jgi:predicted metal-dependent hydrolase
LDHKPSAQGRGKKAWGKRLRHIAGVVFLFVQNPGRVYNNFMNERKKQLFSKIKNLIIIRHPRARRYRLAILSDGTARVTIPKYGTKKKGLEFAVENCAWIDRIREKMQSRPPRLLKSGTRSEYLGLRDEARKKISGRTEHFAGILKVKYNRIAIRNQSSRWGSCSKKGNLNFNYRLAHLTERLFDYVIIHELCHLKEFNHSRKFWELMEKAMPDYRLRRIELKKL